MCVCAGDVRTYTVDMHVPLPAISPGHPSAPTNHAKNQRLEIKQQEKGRKGENKTEKNKGLGIAIDLSGKL